MKLTNKIQSKIYKLFFKRTKPIPISLWIINSFFQRVLRLNGNVPWMVNFTSIVKKPENIKIGKNVWVSFAISGNCYYQGLNGIVIGDDTIIAPGVKIISSNHLMDGHNLWEIDKPIRIGKNCWIGSNSIILPGVEIGNFSVIGAGAVVTKNFPDNSVIVGNPAQIIRSK